MNIRDQQIRNFQDRVERIGGNFGGPAASPRTLSIKLDDIYKIQFDPRAVKGFSAGMRDKGDGPMPKDFSFNLLLFSDEDKIDYNPNHQRNLTKEEKLKLLFDIMQRQKKDPPKKTPTVSQSSETGDSTSALEQIKLGAMGAGLVEEAVKDKIFPTVTVSHPRLAPYQIRKCRIVDIQETGSNNYGITVTIKFKPLRTKQEQIKAKIQSAITETKGEFVDEKLKGFNKLLSDLDKK